MTLKLGPCETSTKGLSSPSSRSALASDVEIRIRTTALMMGSVKLSLADVRSQRQSPHFFHDVTQMGRYLHEIIFDQLCDSYTNDIREAQAVGGGVAPFFDGTFN